MPPSDDLRAELQRRKRNAADVIAYFREHQGEWVDIPTLERLGGRNAWRTRVSDARAVFCDELGWTWPIPKGGPDPIKNQQKRVLSMAHGRAEEIVVSTYRYWPYESLGRPADVQAPTSWPVFDAPSQEPWTLKP